MNKTKCSNYDDRIKFLLAVMTKNYEEAAELGNLVLQQHPTDLHLSKVVPLLKKNARKSSSSGSDIHSSSETSDSETDSIETSGDSSDNESDNDKDDKDTPLTIDTNKYPQKGKAPKKLSQYLKENLAFSMENNRLKDMCFKKKMYRVIPLKMKNPSDSFESK